MAEIMPGEKDRPNALRLGAAAFAGAVGGMALVGWTFDYAALTSFSPGFVAMNPTTAIALLAMSLGLVLPSRREIVLVRLLAALAILLGGAKLVQTLWHLPIGFDRFPFAERLSGAAGMPSSRMAPNAAIVLILIGSSLFASGSRRRPWLIGAQALALAAIAITMVSLVASALDATAMNVKEVYNVMAVNTALALLALAVAVVAINPGVGVLKIIGDRGPAGTLARTALPFLLLVPIVIGLVRLSGQRAGFYGTESGVALQIFANILVTLTVLTGSIVILFFGDKARSAREQATVQSESQYRHAEQVGHIGHWQIEYPTGAVQWSDEFYAICGLTRTDPVTLESTLALFHPDDAAVSREIVATAVKEGQAGRSRTEFAGPTAQSATSSRKAFATAIPPAPSSPSSKSSSTSPSSSCRAARPRPRARPRPPSSPI